MRSKAVLLVELLDTTASSSSFLLSGVERMALGANLDVDLLLGGSYGEGISAVAGYGSFIVIRMDSFSHDFHLSYGFNLISFQLINSFSILT